MNKLILMLLLFLTLAGCNVGDDTDDRANNRTSGLVLYTDYGTGCQYLRAAADGGITPRLAADGKQVCRDAGGTHAN
jgi:hypothetical protein